MARIAQLKVRMVKMIVLLPFIILVICGSWQKDTFTSVNGDDRMSQLDRPDLSNVAFDFHSLEFGKTYQFIQATTYARAKDLTPREILFHDDGTYTRTKLELYGDRLTEPIKFALINKLEGKWHVDTLLDVLTLTDTRILEYKCFSIGEEVDCPADLSDELDARIAGWWNGINACFDSSNDQVLVHDLTQQR